MLTKYKVWYVCGKVKYVFIKAENHKEAIRKLILGTEDYIKTPYTKMPLLTSIGKTSKYITAYVDIDSGKEYRIRKA